VRLLWERACSLHARLTVTRRVAVGLVWCNTVPDLVLLSKAVPLSLSPSALPASSATTASYLLFYIPYS